MVLMSLSHVSVWMVFTFRHIWRKMTLTHTAVHQVWCLYLAGSRNVLRGYCNVCVGHNKSQGEQKYVTIVSCTQPILRRDSPNGTTPCSKTVDKQPRDTIICWKHASGNVNLSLQTKDTGRHNTTIYKPIEGPESAEKGHPQCVTNQRRFA